MEKELKEELLKDSLNNMKMTNDININSQEEDNKNNSVEKEINSNNILNTKEQEESKSDFKNEPNDTEEKFKQINKDDNDTKINNKRVNNLLKDIYGSLSNINEVNNKVKNILSKRRKMNSMNSFRNNYKETKPNSNIKNKRKSFTSNKNKNNYNIKPKITQDEYSTNKKDNIYNRNTYIENEITKNETASMNLKSKNSNNYIYSKVDNNSTVNKKTKNNSTYYSKMNSPVQINLLEKEFNNNTDIKFYKYSELMNGDYSTRLNEKNDDVSNINNNSDQYDEEYENEKIIRYMRIKLKKEEKKLRVLEEQKNKLLNEEKIRRKVLMEKIKNKNRIKKQCLINEYKNKINLIQKLQNNNINEIRKLEIKKKIDEENIKKIEKICENININDSSLTKSKTDKSQRKNSLTKSRLDNSGEGSNILLSDNNETQRKPINKKYKSNYFIYSNNRVIRTDDRKNKNNYNTESEEALTEEFKFNNSINELTSTCDNNEANETFSHSQDINYKRKLNFDDSAKSSKTKHENLNPYNYMYNYYQLINNSNKRTKIKGENINVDNYLNQNTHKKKYHSETRKYSKVLNNTNTKRKSKGSFTPNQEIVSFIQTRVNKYNHSSNKESNLTKRLSQMNLGSTYLKYNLNNKYNYKYMPNTAKNTNGFTDLSRKNTKTNVRNKNKNIKELNFKYIFLNHK